MARLSILFIVLCQFLSLPLSSRCDDENPFMDIASVVLQSMGGRDNNMGGMINNIVASLMQGDNADLLSSVLGQDNANGSGNNAGNIIAGLGSLLGGKDGKIDPSVIGTMVSMFAQQMSANNQPETRQKRQTKENDFNMESIISLASGLMGNKNTAGVLPMILSTLNSFSNNEVQKRSDEHKDHAGFLPPVLEKLHLYWDLFINSELGKTVWEKSGLKRAMKAFVATDGNISFELMMKNFENQSFRRHWIKAATQWLTEMVVHVSKPEVYQRYLLTAEYMINSFLDSRGLPSSLHFNLKHPEESFTQLVNHALKKNLDMNEADVSEYIKPALDYVKEIIKMAQTASKSLSGNYNVVADRLTDTLNLEVIEPVLRVYRAYKHSVSAPHCQEHLMCLVNRHNDQDKQGLPGFKAGLTKLSSLAASAALSFQNGKGFWDLYNAIQNDVNCEAKYPADCAAFHEHELKVTTEVYHSEL